MCCRLWRMLRATVSWNRKRSICTYLRYFPIKAYLRFLPFIGRISPPFLFEIIKILKITSLHRIWSLFTTTYFFGRGKECRLSVYFVSHVQLLRTWMSWYVFLHYELISYYSIFFQSLVSKIKRENKILKVYYSWNI